MGKLTSLGIRKITQPGKYGDGLGLYINVAKGGSKSWIQRITIDGKRREIGLGSFPTIGLTKAREMSVGVRAAVAEGRNPLSEKHEAARTAPTFREAALNVHRLNLARSTNEKHCRNWLQRAEKYVFPVLGDMPLDDISPRDVLGILDQIWTTNHETGQQVRRIMRSVLAWGMAQGHLEINPAGEIISAALPSMPKVRNHMRTVHYRELPLALETIRESGSGTAVKLALEFLTLTTARSGEVRGATWAEINLERRLWIIPASRMKGRIEHRVPLSNAALSILDKAGEIREGDHIFPSPVKEGNGLSDMTLTKVLRSAGLADRMTVHGIRSSFRDWAPEETATPWAVAELAHAHRVGTSVEQAYHRTALLDKRWQLMDDWGEYLARILGPEQ